MKRSRAYLTTVLLAFAAAIGSVMSLNAVGYRYGFVDPEQDAKIRRLLERVEQARHADVVFVGDSSLGRSIDPVVFEEETGLSATVYSATGALGYEFMYNLAAHAARSNTPRLIVFFQTVLTAQSPPSVMGDVLSRGDLGGRSISLPAVARAHLSFTNAYWTIRNLVTGNWPSRYEKSEAALDDRRIPLSMREDKFTGTKEIAGFKKSDSFYVPASAINPGKMEFLPNISDLCKNTHISCVWAHGPLLDEYCRTSEKYINVLSEQVVSAGLTLADDMPACTPMDELDDSPNHPRWRNADRLTRAYAHKILTAVRRDGVTLRTTAR